MTTPCGCRIWPPSQITYCPLHAQAPAMAETLRAFIEQAEKLRGFPQAYGPYIGVLVGARAIFRVIEGSNGA